MAFVQSLIRRVVDRNGAVKNFGNDADWCVGAFL
jgi:hypothetical protein